MKKLKIKDRDVAVIILLNKRNEVLLQKKDLGYKWFPGIWCMPGGEIESGETPEQSLKREILEELNYNLKDFKPFQIINYQHESAIGTREGKEHWYVSRFDGQLSDLRFNEGAGFAFFAKSELKSVPIIHHDLDALIDFYKTLKD